MNSEIKLGCEVRDTITGYVGIVICVAEWLNGCKRITIQAQSLHDGKPVEDQCFDIEQLELVDNKTSFAKVETKPAQAPVHSGGPHDPPSRNPDPQSR